MLTFNLTFYDIYMTWDDIYMSWDDIYMTWDDIYMTWDYFLKFDIFQENIWFQIIK